jgi:hypothetical protein
MLNYIALLAVETRTATPQNEAAILSRNIIECIRKQGLRAKWHCSIGSASSNNERQRKSRLIEDLQHGLFEAVPNNFE